MSLKFRKRIRVFPGFTLNLSKSGMSATVGIKGLSLNVGNKGTYLNTGIPGTGLYDRIRLDERKKNSSSNLEDIDSPNLYGLKQSIIDAQKIKEEMKNEYLEFSNIKNRAQFILVVCRVLVFGFFLKNLKESYNQKKIFAQKLKEEYENFKLSIDFNFDNDLLNDYISLRKAFDLLSKTNKKWDIISFLYNDKYKERTLADTSINRKDITLYEESLYFLNAKYSALVFQNANGGDLYFYPGFMIVKEKSSNEFALIDYRDMKIELSSFNFQEEETVPFDSKQVGSTWKYSNKDGSKDKRYNNNYQIPIMLYGTISFSTSGGLSEKYMFSNYENASLFYLSFCNYVKTLSGMKWDSTTDYQKIEESAG